MVGRGIVSISFDNMGSAAEVGGGLRTTQEDAAPSMVTGYPRVLDLLDRCGVRGSFFVEGWNALHNPDLVRHIHDRGYDIGLHGWMHEPFHTLDRANAERVIYDSLAAFRNIGVEPHGFRAPGGVRGAHCEEVLTKFGVEFDSSIDETASASAPGLLSSGLANIPWQWPMIDYFQYEMHPDGAQAPEQVLATYLGELERAATAGGYAAFIFHAFVSGVDERRFAVLETLLRTALQDDRLEVLTVRQIAGRVVARPEPAMAGGEA